MKWTHYIRDVVRHPHYSQSSSGYFETVTVFDESGHSNPNRPYDTKVSIRIEYKEEERRR